MSKEAIFTVNPLVRCLAEIGSRGLRSRGQGMGSTACPIRSCPAKERSMKELYRHRDHTLVSLYKQMLDAAGIPVMRNRMVGCGCCCHELWLLKVTPRAVI